MKKTDKETKQIIKDYENSLEEMLDIKSIKVGISFSDPILSRLDKIIELLKEIKA